MEFARRRGAAVRPRRR